MPLSLASACLLARRPLTLGVARQARLLSHGGGRFGAPKAWPGSPELQAVVFDASRH